jgi:Ni/Co efflux regulator RcnB
MIRTVLRLAGVAAAAAAIAGCAPSVASLDCNEIADQAKRAGERETIRLTEARNLREESRSEHEARCVGEASWSDNSVTNVYVRAYDSDNGTMVEYRNQPYTEPAR